MANAYRVFVVLDPEYGERLSELAVKGPVWILDTPRNRPVALRLWAANPHRTHLDGVTTFKTSDNCSPEDALMREFDTIDLHHGIHSANPPYTVVEVIGTSISEKLRSKLFEFGFNQFEATAEGFRTTRPLPSD